MNLRKHVTARVLSLTLCAALCLGLSACGSASQKDSQTASVHTPYTVLKVMYLGEVPVSQKLPMEETLLHVSSGETICTVPISKAYSAPLFSGETLTTITGPAPGTELSNGLPATHRMVLGGTVGRNFPI